MLAGKPPKLQQNIMSTLVQPTGPTAGPTPFFTPAEPTKTWLGVQRL